MLSPEEISQELILACGGGVVDHVTFLLEQYHGIIDLEYQEPEYGITALFSATEGGYLGVVKLLLQHGANVNSCDGDERTPLMVASIGGFLDIAELLIINGADVNQKDLGNWTALHYAIFYTHEFMIKYLVSGCDANCSIVDPVTNRSILMEAMNIRNEKIIRLVLSVCKVNLDHLDTKNQSAIDYCLRCCPLLLPEFLLQASVSDEQQTHYLNLLEEGGEYIPQYKVM